MAFELNKTNQALKAGQMIDAKKAYQIRQFLTAVEMITEYNNLIVDSPLTDCDTDEYGNQYKFSNDGDLISIYMPGR